MQFLKFETRGIYGVLESSRDLIGTSRWTSRKENIEEDFKKELKMIFKKGTQRKKVCKGLIWTLLTLFFIEQNTHTYTHILILDNLPKHTSNKQYVHPISIKILHECLLWCLSPPLQISNAIVNSDLTLSDQAWMISCRPNRVAIISFTLAKVNPIICYNTNGQIFSFEYYLTLGEVSLRIGLMAWTCQFFKCFKYIYLYCI